MKPEETDGIIVCGYISDCERRFSFPELLKLDYFPKPSTQLLLDAR